MSTTTILLMLACIPFIAFGIVWWLFSFEDGIKYGLSIGGLAMTVGGFLLASPSAEDILPTIAFGAGVAMIFSIPGRNIATTIVKEKEKLALDYRVIQHKEELSKKNAQENAKLVEEYNKKVATLNKAAKKLQLDQKAADEKKSELTQWENSLLEFQNNLASIQKKLQQDISKYNKDVESLTHARKLMQEEHKTVLETSEKLKGLAGRITPYKAAWKMLLNTQNKEAQASMHSILNKAKENLRNRNHSSSHAPRQPIHLPVKFEVSE